MTNSSGRCGVVAAGKKRRRGDQMFLNVFNRCGIVDGQTDTFEYRTLGREKLPKRKGIEMNRTKIINR